MSTYKEIQDKVRKASGFTPKTCWIAHVKELAGLNPKVAHNRHKSGTRKHPCPPAKIAAIKKALK